MLPSAVHLQTCVWRKCRDYSENCAVPCLKPCKAYSYLRSLWINVAFKVKYILKLFSQERWLKHIWIGKVPSLTIAVYKTEWLHGRLTSRQQKVLSVSSALDKKRVALRQHFGDCQLSLSSRESLLERERTESWGWQLHSSLFSMWWCERAVCSGGGRQCPIQPKTGMSIQGNREEQSYLSSSCHTPAEGHHCWTWKGTDISLHSPESLPTFLLQIKLCQGHSFWTDYALTQSLSMWAKAVASSHAPLHTCEGRRHRSMASVLQTCCKTKVLGLITWDTS